MYVMLACMPTPHAHKRTAYLYVVCWHVGAVEGERGQTWEGVARMYVVLACMPSPHAYKRTVYMHVVCWHAGAVSGERVGVDFSGMYVVLA